MNISESSARYSRHGEGYVKVYRKLLTSAVFQDEGTLKVWVWCLLRANFQPKPIEFMGAEIELKAGDFITGTFAAADELKMSKSRVWRILEKLERWKNITIKSGNRFTIVSVNNYREYQNTLAAEWEPVGNQSGTYRESTENPPRTEKNDKNVKNQKKEEKGEGSPSPIDYEMVRQQWNSFACANGLAEILALNPKRKAAIVARLREKEFDLGKIFSHVSTSDFAHGDNGRGWRMDFDFVFCSPNNYLKILEGKYDNGTNQQGDRSGARASVTAADTLRAVQEVQRRVDSRNRRDSGKG